MHRALLLLFISLAFERKATLYWQYFGPLIPLISYIPNQRLKFNIFVIRDHNKNFIQFESSIKITGSSCNQLSEDGANFLTAVRVFWCVYRAFTI